jgi:gliding motility associated protien GldN
MMVMKRLVLMLGIFCSGAAVFAQETDGQINPNSLIPIPKYEQLYKVRVWRNIDLKEKQNKGFFAHGNEITKLIMDAVKSGELADIYVADSVTRKKSKADFLNDLVSQQGTTYDAWDPAKDYYQADRITFNGKTYEAVVDSKGKNPATTTSDWQATSAGSAVTFLPNEISQLTLQEDIIFDKRRSRLYYDIQSVEMKAFDQNTGTFKPLGWFKYKDLEKVFRNHPDEAIWFNRYNTAENKNYGDAFLLREFHSTIEKVENPDNETIYDTYSANGRPYKESVWAREWEEMKLMEKEHNLWEF